ncbi:MAG: hypothetical protein FJZ58_08480 [Chlamydiae bacterium]|nr:hypothetical protein [Chlamydiota bacterium]
MNTSAASTVRIADAQSANALVAELAFEINDEYSLSGRSLEQIEGEIQSLIKSSSLTSKECRVLQRLLLKASERKKTHAAAYFVHPHREYLEYLQCLYAILDDTDLLSKVSSRDVLCVASLLNRMKTLMEGREVEVICFDDLPQDESFVVKAAQRILQQEEMYSLYQKIYEAKELSIEANLRLCMEGKPSSIFSDTKVQNGCCRVGQTKLFAKNFPFYLSRAGDVRAAWYQGAKAFYADRSDCDLHMHMMSTVPGADDVYAGHVGKYPHQDELWIWIPMQEQAIEHLEMFLSSFSRTPQVMQNQMEVEFLGDNAQEFDQIFAEAFPSVTRKAMKEDSLPIAILRYKAGFLNSRKAMISPYLPKLIG